MKTTEEWSIEIKPKTSLFKLNLADIWKYRDLGKMLIHRDFITFYKQTIFGPLWFIIPPIISATMYLLVFGQLAKLPTDGMPQFLFYMSGIINWGYFSECLNKTSDTFLVNAGVFGKIYFPRMIVPVAGVITSMIRYGIQFAIFLICYFLFLFNKTPLNPNWLIALTPLLLIYMALLGIGCGLWISAVTTKYRDLKFALGFALNLWMYATPVIYPISLIPDKYQMFVLFNPVAIAIEIFRKAYLGAGTISFYHVIFSIFLTLFILITGIIIFNKTERTFIDTV